MNSELIKSVVGELLAENLNTIEYYFEVYEELSAERESLHQEIIQSILSRRRYSRENRIFMLGGAPANGKSSFLNSGVVAYPKDALKIGPDEIKGLIPEYRYMTGIDLPNAAELVHEESSNIARELRQIAIQEGYDIILDGVANDVLEKRLEDLELLRLNAHTIRMDYITLDTKLSVRLAEERYKKTGRQVPEWYILEKNRMIAKLVPQLIDNNAFDELYLWDTNVENCPRLILTQKNGKLAIKDIALYSNFKKKAYETW